MTPGKVVDWLYLPDALVEVISRLVGVISLPVAATVWIWTHAGCVGTYYPQPFNVPTWRFGTSLLPVPLPPEPINIAVFVLFAAASLLLIFGKWYRPLYIYMASVLAFYTAREFFVCCLHWVLLNFLFLAALSFRAKDPAGRSPTRRLIQLTVASCYIFGVLQKIFYPDFWQGLSLEAAFYDGFAVTAPFKSFFIEHQLPMSFWSASAVLLILVESAVAVGLFFKKTRLAACALGLVLHGGIVVMMEWVLAIFSLEMWTGYLAFFDAKEKTKNTVTAEPGPEKIPPSFKPSPLKTALSLIFIALLIFMPLRIYYLPGPPADLLTLFERTPWGFGMFLMRQKVEELNIAFEDSHGQTHNVEASGRMHTASNDNELIAIAAYVSKNNPDARCIRINDVIVVNESRRILRTLIWDQPQSPTSSPKISVASAGDYCRGAANRSPVVGRHP
jgi:hypothetical protein